MGYILAEKIITTISNKAKIAQTVAAMTVAIMQK